MKINESILISQKPEMVWSFWMDVSNDIHWREGITKAEWTTQPPHGKGSTGVHYHKDLGSMCWEVTSFEDGRGFEFIHTEGKLKGSVVYFKVEPENNSCRVSVFAELKGSFFMSIIMLLMGSFMKKGMRSDLQKLKDYIEKQDANS